MVECIFSIGDIFTVNKEYGLVLPDNKALMFGGVGERNRNVTKVDMPENPKPVWDLKAVPFGVKFAIAAVKIVL